MEEKKNVFVYIRGVKDRGQEVIDTLVKLGGTNFLELKGINSNNLYYIDSSGTISYTENDCSLNSIWLKKYYTELFLPKKEHIFKPFDKVLARYSNIAPWQADLYSHYDADNSYVLYGEVVKPPVHVCVGSCYEECIPYEGNEHLLGTTDNPREK